MATRRKDDLWLYKAPSGLDQVERAVDFLVWAAKHCPKRAVPMTHIVRVALSGKKLPREDSKDVALFRSGKFGRVKKIILREHKQAVVYFPGFGYRVTVDDDDMAATYVEKKAHVAKRAAEGLNGAVALVDPDKLHKKAAQERFANIADASKRLNAPAILKRLEKPAADDDE